MYNLRLLALSWKYPCKNVPVLYSSPQWSFFPLCPVELHVLYCIVKYNPLFSIQDSSQ